MRLFCSLNFQITVVSQHSPSANPGLVDMQAPRYSTLNLQSVWRLICLITGINVTSSYACFNTENNCGESEQCPQPLPVFCFLLCFLFAPFHQEMLVYVLDNKVWLKKNSSLVFPPLAVTAD